MLLSKLVQTLEEELTEAYRKPYDSGKEMSKAKAAQERAIKTLARKGGSARSSIATKNILVDYKGGGKEAEGLRVAARGGGARGVKWTEFHKKMGYTRQP